MKNTGCVCVVLLMCVAVPSWAQDAVVFADGNLRAAVEALLGPDPNPAALRTLRQFDASARSIASLSGLEYAENLETLRLSDNAIQDLTPLAGLVGLKYLFLADNRIEDIGPLAGLVDLVVLDLRRNEIEVIDALSDMSHLSLVGLGTNRIRDIAPLAGLTQLTEILLRENPLNAQAYETWIPFIEANGVDLIFEYDLSPYVQPVGSEMRFDDVEEFEERVRIEEPPPGVVLVEHVEEAAAMRMRTIEVYTARAKVRMGNTGRDHLRVRIRYQWLSLALGARLDVYVTDQETFGDPESPRYVKAGTILPPTADYPGSTTSITSALHEFPLDASGLSGTDQLWIETVLVQRVTSPAPLRLLAALGPEARTGAEVEIKLAAVESVCQGICLDLNNDNGTNEDDFFYAYLMAGQATQQEGDTSAHQKGPVCADRGFSSDGYLDSLDFASLHWRWNLCPDKDCPKNFCPEVPLFARKLFPMNVSVHSISLSAVPPVSEGFTLPIDSPSFLILANRMETRQTLFETKRTVSVDQYLFSVSPHLSSDANDSHGVLAASRLDPFGIRLVKGQGDESLFLLGSNGGVLGFDGQPLIRPGRASFEGNDVYIGLQGSGSDAWGRPILDAIVADGDVYVVPVVVRPVDSHAYLAAAQLRPQDEGEFEIVRLFVDPEAYSGNEQAPNLTGLREIERDPAGNLYVLNVHGQNESSTLWRFAPDGTIATAPRRLDQLDAQDRIPHPSHICYSKNRIYLTSGASATEPNGVSLATVWVLDADDLGTVGSVTIRDMFHITDLAVGPDGIVYATGYAILANHHWTGIVEQSLPSPRLAAFLGTRQSVVQADSLSGDYDVAVPLSIVWSGP